MGKKSRDDLLIKIAHCPYKLKVWDEKKHSCSEIVKSQKREEFQLPEPWNGHINKARLMFLSSNPSIDTEDKLHPVESSSDTYIKKYFENNFEGRANDKGGRFWNATKGLAKILLGENVRIGKDYVLAEVVHCKSKNAKGVRKARKKCSELYLKELLKQSKAKLIVCLGRHARKAMHKEFNYDFEKYKEYTLPVGGRDRHFVFIPHPQAPERKTKSENCLKKVKYLLS